MTLPFQTPVAADTLGRAATGPNAGPAGGEVSPLTVVAQPAGPAPAVVGLDLSLTRTGIATRHGAVSLTPPSQLRGFPRMRWIRASVLDWTRNADLVIVERLAYNSNSAHTKDIAGLWHVVMVAVDARGVPWVDVASATRCKYATGSGRGGKDEVLTAAIKRLPVDVTNNDEADAAWLCAIGHDLLGQPLAPLPQTHRCALDTIRNRDDLPAALTFPAAGDTGR